MCGQSYLLSTAQDDCADILQLQYLEDECSVDRHCTTDHARLNSATTEVINGEEKEK